MTAEVVALADAILEELGMTLDEAKGEYYYDTENVKVWVLGSGGASGNCETCEGNADMGHIGDDEVFDGVSGDVDEPPAHPNCDCTVEYRERRYRVYV